MNILNKKKKINELKDRESRQFFYEEHIETGIPFQLRELRKKRKLTQKQLAELTGFDQSNISEWENPNYQYTPQIGTLQRFANAFDVPLIVRFGSWDELLELDSNLSPEKVAPASFDEFVEQVELEAKEKENNENGGKLLNYPKAASKPKIKPIKNIRKETFGEYSEAVSTSRPFKLHKPKKEISQTNTTPELPFPKEFELVLGSLDAEKDVIQVPETQITGTTGRTYSNPKTLAATG